MSESGASGDPGRDRTAERFAALGLDRDPFPESDLHVDFFSRGGRERHLDALADLWGLGRPLVLVTGPAGVGRSTCFHALMRRLPDDVRSARVTAGVFLSARNLLQAVARAMGLAVDAEEDRDEIRERVYQQITELSSTRTLCAVLVDDADELEADALEELISLAELSAETPNVRVLLFGGEGLRRVLADAVGADRVDPLAHEVSLEPYTLNELRGYLQFRLARAGLSGASPFTEQDYQDIYVASRGLPRDANKEARRILLSRSGRLSPAQIRVIGAGVAAFVVIGLLIVLLSPSPSEPAPQAVRELPVPVARTVDLTLPAQAAAPSGTRESSPSPSGLRDGGWVPLGSAFDSDTDSATDSEAWEDASGVAARMEAEPVTEEAAAAPASPPVAAAPAAAAPAAAAPATEGHALLGRDASRFVLQVLVLSARDRADAWVEQQQNPEAYEIYSRTRNGATQYVVLHGDYPDRSAASAAAAGVARATGQTPFLRDMASVQRELED